MTGPQGWLEVRELNELAAGKQVLSLTLALDSCVQPSNPEPRIAGNETVLVEPRTVSAGPHKLRFVLKLRDSFSADYQTNDQVVSTDAPIDVPAGGTSFVTVRMVNDARGIMLLVMHSRSQNPPAKAAAADRTRGAP
jgi:hypothetical protein